MFMFYAFTEIAVRVSRQSWQIGAKCVARPGVFVR